METELLRHPVVPVLWVVLVQLGAWGLGDRILGDRIRVPGNGLLRAFHAVLFGFGVLQAVLFGLGLLGGLHPWVVGGLAGILGVAAGLRLRRCLSEAMKPFPAGAGLLLAPAVVLALFLPHSLAPVVHHDDATYHLRLPALYLESGALVELPTLLYANMPHAADLLGVLALAPGDLAGPKLMTFGFVGWLLAGLGGLARPRIGVAATTILLLSVLAGKQMQWLLSTANVEPLLACLFLAALHALLRWRQGEEAWAPLFGAHLGFACAIKYTAWPLAALLFACALMPSPRRSRPPWRATAIACLIVFAFVTPWLVRNAAVTGNPLYPNLPGMLDGIFWSPVQERHWHQAVAAAGEGPERTFLDRALSPFHLTLGDDYYNAPSFSISFMAGLLVALWTVWRSSRQDRLLTALAWLGFAVWAAGPMNGRYLVAWMGPLALGAMTTLRPVRHRPKALLAVLIFVLVSGVWQLRNQRYPYAVNISWLTERGRSETLRRTAPWRLASWLEAKMPVEGRLLALWENRFLFLDRGVEVDSVYQAPTGLARLREAGSAATFARDVRSRGITHVVVHVPQMNRYLENAYGWDLVDPEVYPRERFTRDKELLHRFLRDELTLLETTGPWALFALTPTPADAAARPGRDPEAPAPSGSPSIPPQ